MSEWRSSGSWNDVHCETYNNWLCKIRTGVTPNPPPDSIPGINKTSDGWLEWNGAQYYINSNSIAMEEARAFCRRRHSDLVVINSEAESVFLWKQVSKSYGSYWIGLNVDLDKTYGWMDGSSVVFQRWDENQPLFQHNDENCAVMTSSMGFWHVYNCGSSQRIICKRSGSPHANATVAPTVLPTGGCPQNWKKFDSKCYSIINNQNETWHGAKAQCKAMGGNLASIVSREVQVFLTAKLAEAPATDLWIGLYNRKGRQFLWTDGRPMRYSNWGNDLPLRLRPMRLMHPAQWRYRRWQNMDYDMGYERYHMMQREEKECAVMTSNPTIGLGKWIKMSCNDTNGYICLQNIDPSLPETPEPTMTDYVKIFNDSIKLVSQQMNWDAAKKHCERDGAKLASLRNQWAQTYAEQLVLNVIKGPVWIGMNKMETGGYFRYIDGWRLTATYWGRREPSTFYSCVFVDVDGKWSTADCNRNMTSICMKSTDVPPTESSAFPGFCPDDPETSRYSRNRNSWQPFRGYCYLFLTERMKWTDGSANCLKHGGNLVSIDDPSEQAFIQSNLLSFQDTQSSFWIGLYKTHNGLWKWLDKATMDYTNWNEDEASNSGYGTIKTADGKWLTANGWHERGYVCKTSKILRSAPQTTVNPSVDPQTRGHSILAVVLVSTAIAIGTGIALFLFKKSGRRLSIPKKLSTFDNPLFFNNERFDTNKLVENAEEENPGPVTAM